MGHDALDDRALQAAYQGWMRNDRGSHLDDAAWQRLGAGDAAQSERNLLFAHIMTCAECSQVWRGVSFLRQQAEEEGLIDRRSPARQWFRPSMWMPASIAALLVLVIGTSVMLRRTPPAGDVVRGAAALSPVEGLMMSYASDSTPMLLWTPVSAASTYKVEIFSEDGNPLWSGDIAAPPMRWPPDAPRARGAYRWRVEAQGAAGVIARSRLTPVELTR